MEIRQIRIGNLLLPSNVLMAPPESGEKSVKSVKSVLFP